MGKCYPLPCFGSVLSLAHSHQSHHHHHSIIITASSSPLPASPPTDMAMRSSGMGRQCGQTD